MSEPSSAHGEYGSIVITNAEDVEPVPVSSMTVAHDQGMARVMVSSAVNGSPDLLVSNFRMGPHQHHPRHLHPNVDEVYFILEGRCRMQVGARTEWVGPGTAIYTPRGTPHCVDTGEEGVSVLVIFPEGDFDKVGKEFVEPDSEERF
jgi:quercetin dioxygenase-like cupin family protein